MPNNRFLDILRRHHRPDLGLPSELSGNNPESAHRRKRRIDLNQQRSRGLPLSLPVPEPTRKLAAGTAIGTLNWDSQIDQVFMDGGMAEFLDLRGADSLGTLEDLAKRIRAEERSAVLSLIRSCMLHGRDFSTPVTLRGASGERPLTWIGTALRAESGRPNRLLLAGHRLAAPEPDGVHDADCETGIGMVAGEAMLRASHDIRNSISAIIGVSRLLAEDGDLGSNQRRYAETISKNAGELMQIIDDVFAKGKRQVLPSGPTAFRLSELMTDLVEMFDAGRRTPAVELTFELLSEDVLISADRVKIRRILVNLLDNALKFTEEGSVRLRGGYREPSLGSVGEAVFEVEDTGIGIDSGDLKRIFEPYRQVPGTHAANSGIGLGLTIAKDLAKHLGGDLQVHSQVGRGTRFRIAIPVTDELTAGSAAQNTQTPDRTMNGLVHELETVDARLAEDFGSLGEKLDYDRVLDAWSLQRR